MRPGRILRNLSLGCLALAVIVLALIVLSALLLKALQNAGILKPPVTARTWVLVRTNNRNAHPHIGSPGGYVPSSWRTIPDSSRNDHCHDENDLKLCDYSSVAFDVEVGYLGSTHAAIVFSLYHYHHVRTHTAWRYLTALLPVGSRLKSCRNFQQTHGANGPAHVCLYMYRHHALLAAQYLHRKPLDKIGFGAPTQGLVIDTHFYPRVGYTFVKP